MSKVRVLSDILDANNDLDIARLKSSGVTAGSYGSAANVPVITIDANGRITAAANTAVAGVSAVDYDTVTGIYKIETSAGTSYPKDLGIGTADSPSFTGLTVTNTITGNIATSDKWKTARTIALTGGVTGSQTIDGSGNVSIATTVTAQGVVPFAKADGTSDPINLTSNQEVPFTKTNGTADNIALTI